MDIKKLILLATLFAFILSCDSGDRGQLRSAKGKKYFSERPYGMVEIPTGAFVMGKSDDDIAGVHDAPTKTVTVNAYYMDETEITNGEYRSFVEAVRDSVIRTRLAEMAELEGKTPGNNDIGEYAYKYADTTNLNPYQKYMLDTYGGGDERPLNKDEDLVFDTDDYPDVLYAEVMDEMYLSSDESFNGQRTWDVTKFKYKYSVLDIEKAAKNKGLKRSEFITKTELEIYPDTTVWIRDFAYSYNEPMHNDYFWHDAYTDYPVVGVSWDQAKAFCQWRTQKHNDYQKERGKSFVKRYRLPNEAEWEYAARGGLRGATYPWGNNYTLNDRGCFLANFKPLRGDYAADQALYTVEADAYEANDFGLYNMAGNVSEWVNSSYSTSSYEFMSSINPNVEDKNNKRKVVRGGSWKDVAYFLQVSSRDYEYADSARSYIGFRTVQSYLGSNLNINTRRPQ